MKLKRLERMAINRVPRLTDEQRAVLVISFIMLAVAVALILMVRVMGE